MPPTPWLISTGPWLPATPAEPRMRVIIDNDFAGDPHDLYQLAALQSHFEPDASSSDYAVRPCPSLDGSGNVPGSTGRDVRVFTTVDTRLMFEDMFIELDLFTKWLGLRP